MEPFGKQAVPKKQDAEKDHQKETFFFHKPEHFI